MNEASFLRRVTAVILTWEEEENLGRSLGMLGGLGGVIVVDSGSRDGTRALAGQFPGVTFVERPFDAYREQWNFGLGLVETEWVLVLDADHVLTEELRGELKTLEPAGDCAGYVAGFEYWMWGRPLRGNLYPAKVILFRRGTGIFEQDGHTQRLRLEGHTEFLKGRVRHDDRKPMERWWAAQWRYAGEEALKLVGTPWRELNAADRVRRFGMLAPWCILIYTLFWKGLVWDGWPGWGYVIQRTVAELVLSLRLTQLRVQGAQKVLDTGSETRF